MKFLGLFYDPDHAGEGLAFDEGDDGKVFLHLYSYKKGAQFWLFGVGSRSGNVALVDCWEPIGGDLGDKVLLKTVQEIPWGQITLTDMTDGKINVLFSPLSGPPWFYTVESAHKLTSAPPPIVVPPPVIIPIPPSPVIEPTTKIRIEVWVKAGDKSFWSDTKSSVLNSSAPVPASWIGSRSYLWSRNRITVLKNDLTITSVSTGGPNNPKMTGISKKVYPEGSVIEIDKFVGPLNTGKMKGWDQSNYNVKSAELGAFYNSSAQVMYEL